MHPSCHPAAIVNMLHSSPAQPARAFIEGLLRARLCPQAELSFFSEDMN